MRHKMKTWIGMGMVMGAVGAIAIPIPSDAMPMPHNSAHLSEPFQTLEQPLMNKVAVTILGSGLIGLELWWFLWADRENR